MEELPIIKYKEEIVRKIQKNTVCIIFGGETGCGKSTKIPQFIMDDCKGDNVNILITQPRKIAAMTLAKRVSMEQKCDLGRKVGYQIGLSKKMDKENHETKLLFCTTGVVLEKIIYEKGINRYSHIILDEIHERDVDTDLLMTIIREYLLIGNSNTKLILMSATLNLEQFKDYFTLSIKGNDYEPSVVEIHSERKFSIDITYLENLEFQLGSKIIKYDVPSINTEMYRVAAKIITKKLDEASTKSILVFLPGIYEIEFMHSILSDYEINDKCVMIVLHSSLPTDKQKEAFMRSVLPKVILSTNIAESSVTIPDVDCVIDFCLTKNIVCEGSSMSCLKTEFTSKNSCIQRAGRTGRVCDGKVYRLINRFFYKLLLQENIPEMQRAPLESVVLRVKSLDNEPPVPFLNKCISPPERNGVIESILKLKELGGLKLLDKNDIYYSDDGELTYVGRLMTALPIDVQLTKLIVFGYMFSVMQETIIIAAGLNIKSIFQSHFKNELQDYIHKIYWANGSGCDAIAILNAYNFWMREREKGTLRKYEDEQKWCNQHGLDRKNLNEMRLLVFKITDRLKMMNFEQMTGADIVTWDLSEKPLIIKLCLAGAFIPNYFMKGKSNKDIERDVYKLLIGLDPNRTVYFRKMDEKQVREVYVDRIKEKMVSYGITDSTKGIKVSFDFTKVMVQFSNENSMIDSDENYNLRFSSLIPGNICNDVYKAVKFRKTSIKRSAKISDQGENFCNMSFELEVLPENETKEYAKKHNLLEIVNGEYKTKKLFYNFPEYVCLPSYNTKEMRGFIRHIEHCNKFYYQTVDDENESVLLDIENSFRDDVELFEAQVLKIDKLVVVYHAKWYKRARIVQIFNNSRSADCYFIDYGYTHEIPFEQIFEAKKDVMLYYFSIPEKCFECRLAEIGPSYIKCPRGKWTKEAIGEFSEKALNYFSTIVVYSVVQDVAAVILYVDSENINEYLIEKGYAKKCGEPYVSRLNHYERENVQSSLTDWITRGEEFKEKINETIKTSVPSPPIEKCKKTIRLDGPYSPLETHIDQIWIKGYKRVQMDPHSVNSVVLDNEVENYEGTMIVAADVMNNQDKGYTLYNVSTMPNIHGLPTVLALMFATNVIFYADKEQTRYAGLRFGLGFHEKNLKAFHYDHDSFVPINYVDELQGDIVDANFLRLLMSRLLTNQIDLTNEQKSQYMKDIKYKLIKLLTKDRQPVENTMCAEETSYWKSNCEELVFMKDIYKAGPYPSIKLPPLKKYTFK